MLSWRRVHAMQTLLDHDYTVIFIEPDAVIQKNPLQLIHDPAHDADDLIVWPDYGLGTSARKHANTKVMVAKPSVQGKKLFNVWQRAEQTYKGEKAETGFCFRKSFLTSTRAHGEDQRPRPNHRGQLFNPPRKGRASHRDGYGMRQRRLQDQLYVSALAPRPTKGPPTIRCRRDDYDGVAMGCDHAGREKVFKISNAFAKKKLASSKLGKTKKSEGKD